jgi:dihydrofolate reductase
MKKEISLIVATSKNNVIAKEGQIPWKCPQDMKLFRQTTTGNTIIMGKKTFDTLPSPLKNRENIVVTRNKNLKLGEDVIVVNSLEEAFEKASHDIFVIGGGEIYNQTIDLATTIYRSVIDINIENGDVFFPEIDEKTFTLFDEQHIQDITPFKFQIWKRN